MKLSRVSSPAPSEVHTADLADRYRSVRETTESLCRPLSAEDAAVQSMPNASPAKWHLAHTSWFFETFVLERAIAGYEPVNLAFRVLFNSYYQTVGEQFARPLRGLLTRPSLAEVHDYRRQIDDRIDKLLHSTGLRAETTVVMELGLHHEQQHQELLLTDIKHLFSFNPLSPAYLAKSAPRILTPNVPRQQWQRYQGGVNWVGATGESFAFDNEGPRHRAYVESFELASRLVTNREYLAFMEADGYTRPEFWLSDAWDTVRQQAWQAPLYWRRHDDAWQVHTLAGLRQLDLDEPVCHVSYYEADAYARFAGARLPTEQEWEIAACNAAVEGNLADSGLFHPAPASETIGESALQLFGDVWEWTRSAYLPYPGYRATPGALGEYNGKFMSNQMVLRGGSCATPLSHIRATYRNFFQPDSRWQFSGIRLARD